MKRIHIVGTSGSGKTHLASRLSEILNIKHTQIDGVFWQDYWQSLPPEKFKEKIAAITEKKKWIFCGNYSIAREIIWKKADTLIWLDLPFSTTLKQLFQRTLNRSLDKEKLWGTQNTENFRMSFASRDSIILWMLKTYRRNKRHYSHWVANPPHSQMKTIRLTSHSEADRWLLKTFQSKK